MISGVFWGSNESMDEAGAIPEPGLFSIPILSTTEEMTVVGGPFTEWPIAFFWLFSLKAPKKSVLVWVILQLGGCFEICFSVFESAIGTFGFIIEAGGIDFIKSFSGVWLFFSDM